MTNYSGVPEWLVPKITRLKKRRKYRFRITSVLTLLLICTPVRLGEVRVDVVHEYGPAPQWLSAPTKHKDFKQYICTVIFIASGTTWAVPADWNSTNNNLQTVGSGGNGVAGDGCFRGGGGGGGGAWNRHDNAVYTPGNSITVAVAAAGSVGDTLVKNNANSANQVMSKGGSNGSAGTGGAGGSGAGGAGGGGSSNGGAGANQGGAFAAGGGGGGAGGPDGAGNAGTAGAAAGVGDPGGVGGSSDAGGDAGGTGGTGGNPNGAAGGAGTKFDATHGCGGGGQGGGSVSGNGGAGGLYGGGGGGGALFGTGGAGKQGLIVITYIPAVFVFLSESARPRKRASYITQHMFFSSTVFPIPTPIFADPGSPIVSLRYGTRLVGY